MTDIARDADNPDAQAAPPPGRGVPALLFAAVVFLSAALVFVVEPMIARLMLPLLGGSAAVWNTSLAFFQIALLAGYGYAHALQRLRQVRTQIWAHLAVLVVAGALALPLHVTSLLGDPPPDRPALWLVAALALSVGAPFAALSATAPLVQAWRARAGADPGGREPYVLYAASNFGSLLALLAYPVAVEPGLALRTQTLSWSMGYGVFVLLVAVLGLALWRAGVATRNAAPTFHVSPPVTWLRRLTWLGLAAAPSSLMLGVTSYITTDLGSAPFMWVAPLALYLVTFIIAFQQRPAIPAVWSLRLQALTVCLCAVFIGSLSLGFFQALAMHLAAFFFTALVCHQALVAQRPAPDRLTEFYIWMSLGGVVGGAFNAFVAPVTFNTVVEYPAVLALACLARPWGRGPIEPAYLALMTVGVLAVAMALALSGALPWGADLVAPIRAAIPNEKTVPIVLSITASCALFMSRRAVVFTALIALLCFASVQAAQETGTMLVTRGFFGVLRVTQNDIDRIGPVRMLIHGTTMHGAQSQDPRLHCIPMTYYGPRTPIGQVFLAKRAARPALSIGAVGLGAGAVAAYTRPGDSLRFFEIDPQVERISRDPAYFTYVTECAHGRIDYTIGDARLTLARQPAGAYDLLLIDAFTSDSVPAHLLTVEAMKMYLSKLKPDGIVILHLSNRNLDLMSPAQALAPAAGAVVLAQNYQPPQGSPPYVNSGEQVVVLARTPAAMAGFMSNPGWMPGDAGGVRAWTDDYTNLFGALVRRIATQYAVAQLPPIEVRARRRVSPAAPPPPPPGPPGPPPGR